MAWDRARPVPWPRLLKQFAVYLVLFNLALVVFARDDYGIGLALGSVVGALFYVAIAYVLVKFGWGLPGDKQAARAAAARSARARERASRAPAAPPPRSRPAPTKRTSGGRPPSRRR